MSRYFNIPLALIMCVTLGLAPFSPEPHVVGKIRWVMGGAIGMTPMDWFDLLMHGFPFVYLLTSLFFKFRKNV